MGRRKQKGVAPPPLEKDVQAAVLEHWLALGLPNTFIAAIPNMGAMGQPGLTRGLPDLIVLGPRIPGGVGFIELKRDHKSPISDAQQTFGALCEKLGVAFAVAVGRDAPIMVLEEWNVVRRQASAA
jgi:hypothetical protein